MNVLVVSDVRVRYEALSAALQARGISVMTCDVDAATRSIAAGRPDVVLVDHPPPAGLVLVRQVLTCEPSVLPVPIAVPDDEDAIVQWIEAGAAAYLTTSQTFDERVDTRDDVVAGEVQASPRAIAALMRRVVALSAAAAVAEPIELLTCREEEVAQLLLVGLSNKEIAQRLTIEVATVKNHVHNILGKLHARRRGEAVALMQGHGEALVALEGGSNDLDP